MTDLNRYIQADRHKWEGDADVAPMDARLPQRQKSI